MFLHSEVINKLIDNILHFRRGKKLTFDCSSQTELTKLQIITTVNTALFFKSAFS